MNSKSIIFLTALCACIFTMAACSETGKNKNVSTQQTGKVKVHTYSAEGANAVIVENTKLVVFDSFGGSEADKGLKGFIDSLKKPVERVFISHGDDHHWIGINTLFPDADIYSTDADAIKKNPKGAALPVKFISDKKLTLDGVTYEFTVYADLGAWVIKLPAQKIAMIHHLGYAGFHVPLPPLDTRLDILKGLASEGYAWFIGGHGSSMAAGKYISAVESYNKSVKKAVLAYKTPAEAKTGLVNEYPNWGGDYLLDIFLPMFYK